MELPRPGREDETDPVLPLINVVFLLLIFFIMTGALHALDYYAVDPASSTSQTHDVPDNSVILVNRDGQVAIDNAPVADDALAAAVAGRLAANPDAVFRLKADGNADAARIVEIMEKLEAAGVRRVVLLTLGTAK